MAASDTQRNVFLIHALPPRNGTYDINNNVYSLLLGNVIPDHLRGTTDDTFYTHYST